jgi:hypothetical protein
MTPFIRRFFAFWADFLIGDDWALAAGVVVVLVLARVANLSDGVVHDQAWMVAPIGVVLVLTVSLGRAVRSSDRSP